MKKTSLILQLFVNYEACKKKEKDLLPSVKM